MGEYTQPVSMVKGDGLVNFGWARQPLFDVNMTAAASVHRHIFSAWRLKRWEYFYVATPTVFFAAQIAHLGYLANLTAYLYDIERNVLLERIEYPLRTQRRPGQPSPPGDDQRPRRDLQVPPV